ncbi:Tim44 domain-containing protein [Marinimicrococcus flavescens]|uniref:TIM44-like domain-containing protein n=1 Tax=Marinimicrococcus flavescens TaxID=3031815 RepID=A0AAP4D4V6_9PROT|nr:TIM44-like domain-containing protein [Marinimicrococcus flavescens]
MSDSRSRRRGLLALVAVFLLVAASVAEARGGRGGSFGSRGSRSFVSPPATQTAPRQASPLQNSQSTAAQPTRQTGAAAGAAGAGRGFASRGGFMGGLLGAGLLGMLLGYGFMGGMGGIASFLGLLLQVGLVVFLGMLAWRFFQRRFQPAAAGGAPLHREAATGPMGGRMGGMSGRSAGQTPIDIQQQDYDSFEQLLQQVQAAYAAEDTGTLGRLATAEVAGHLEGEIAENVARGVRNELRDVRLLQGDLAEAWREGSVEYATVAMRFSLIDVTLDRKSNAVVEGSETQPVEALEIWTFMRPVGGAWQLSAIQQA